MSQFRGTCKWFNANKGFGFIVPDNGGADVFIHIRDLEKTGLKTLNDGQTVTYDIMQNRGKDAAANVKLI